ncbi:hypothetical protein G6O45_23320, partial [Salmonella enterica subsp. enterica serovar Istanbul]|nr:hypothetical protein [Salmonella enterica subsp. enterica serovar Istanbul]
MRAFTLATMIFLATVGIEVPVHAQVADASGAPDAAADDAGADDAGAVADDAGADDGGADAEPEGIQPTTTPDNVGCAVEAAGSAPDPRTGAILAILFSAAFFVATRRTK